MDVGLLLGRDRQLSVLVDALDGAGRSQGGLVVLVGEPGIGKTALLGEVARIATGRGWVTALGRAHHDHTEAPPYWPWIQILRRLRRVGVLADDHEWLLRALSPTDDTDPGGRGRAPEHVARSRFEIADRMVQALADSAADRPLLIGLDDVHAADPSSLRMLEFLAAVLDDLPLAVVAASRAPVPGTLVETLLVETLRHPAARELVIPGLTAPDVATFLQAIHAADAALADDVWHLTAGNPLYVREVARMLSEGGDDRSGRFPVRLTAALRSRLSSLDPPARRLLDALAVVGEEADVDLLAAMAGGDIEPALAQATGAGIVAVTAAGQGRAARYCHPLLREAVYTDLSAADRVAWHERAASTLAASRAPPLDALAVHLCAAARPETAPQAVDAARSAAARAERLHAYDEAAAHLERGRAALALCPTASPRDDVDLVLATADVQRRAGDFGSALDAYRRGYLSADEAGLGDLRAGAALGYEVAVCESGQMRTGRDDRSIVQLQRAIDGLDGRDGLDALDRSAARLAVLARAKASLARACFFVNDGEGANRWAPAAVDDARRSRDPEAVAFSLECLRTVSWARATSDERAALCAEIERHAVEADAFDLVLQARHFALYEALAQGDVVTIDRLVAEFNGLADSLQLPHARAYGELFRAMRALHRGDLVDAGGHVAAADAIGGRIRSVNIAQFCTAQRFTIARLDGEWGDLPERFAEFVGPTGSGPTWRCMSAQLAAETGDGDGARAGLEAMADAGYRSVSTDAHFLFSLCCLAEAAVILGERARAAELLDLLTPHAEIVVPNITALHGTVKHTCGGLALTIGDVARARHLLEEALARHVALGAGAWALASRLRLAQAIAAETGDDDGSRARDLLDLVARDAEAKGLTRLARQARDLSGRGDADRPDPLASLTGREREVVALIAEGRSNLDISRELFISLKTVKSHVSHVFTKLDATSRTQVALLVQRTGQPAGTDGSETRIQPKAR